MDDSGDPDFNETSAQLNEGLQSCRAILSSYRVLLSGQNPPANDDDLVPEEPDGSGESTAEG